jgi:hypothetical protein
MVNVAGPQSLGFCFSYSGGFRTTLPGMGVGENVGVGESTSVGVAVAIMAGVVEGEGVPV